MSPWLDLARVHAPLMILLTPLIGAALAFAVPSRRASWVIACIAALLTALIALDIGALAAMTGVMPLFAQETMALRYGGFAAFAAPLLACVATLVLIGAGARLRTDWARRAAPFAMALILAALGGWLGALMADDLAALVVSLELAWLASVGVIALSAENQRGGLSGALRMLTAGGVGGALMVIGAGFLYRSLGSSSLNALAGAHIATPDLAAVGAGLMIAALALKAGAAPLHLWMGAAYGRGGGAAVLALGVITGVGALAVLARVAIAALAAPALADGLAVALAALGVLSVLVGSLQAIGARSLPRLAAYAATAQVGCVLATLALGSPAGNAAVLVQIFAFAAAALALLGGAAVFGEARLTALDGRARAAPVASAAIAFGALSLMAAPLTIGFLGRWRLIEAGVGGGWSWTAGAVIVASLAAVFYGGRLIERLYFRRATTAVVVAREPWRIVLAPALVAAIAAIMLGLAPNYLLHAADLAATIGEGP